MDREVAFGLAAQAWCKPETQHKVMDPQLAEAFANILLTHNVNPVESLSKQFRLDDGFAWGWYCNLAMAMVDVGVDRITANKAATSFMRRAFDIDVREPGDVPDDMLLNVGETLIPKDDGNLQRLKDINDGVDTPTLKQCNETLGGSS